MGHHKPDEGAERRQAEDTREGFLEGVGTLVLAALYGVAVFFGLGAWFLVSKAYYTMASSLSGGVIILGATLIAGGVYGFYKL